MKIFIWMILCFSTCFANYHVKVEEDNGLRLSVETIKEEKTICGLIISELKIQRPVKGVDGSITLSITPSHGYHAMAFGKRRGSFLFERGNSLPKLIDGRYLLVIDEKTYGFITLDKKDVKFEKIGFLEK